MPLAPIETKVSASFNIAPSQDVLVLKPNPEMIKWSYSPKWKEDIKLINCRHETLLEKPSFKGSMRCVFVANGWIEWQRLKNEKNRKKCGFNMMSSVYSSLSFSVCAWE